MPPAARIADPTSHGPPLSPGPGSPNVLIGARPAWRALPASVAAAVESASKAVKQFMQSPVLTPANAAPKIAKITSGLARAAAKAAAAGNPAGVGAAASSATALNVANAGLSAAWTTASALPGGQPGANKVYTEGIKAAMAGAASPVFSAIGGMTDMHVCPIPCPIPPHGPGVVTRGSKTVVINNLPATRQGDKVFEACGGADPIAVGCPSVDIGDLKGTAGAGGDAGSSNSSASDDEDDAAAETMEEAEATSTASGPVVDNKPDGEEPAAPQPGESEQQVGTGKHWLEIELVDEAEQPVVGEQYTVRLPDNREINGRLDARGQTRITGIEPPGWCRISFPKLDLAAWQRWTPSPQAADNNASPSATPGAAEPGSGPVGGESEQTKAGESRRLRQGECISSIAKDTGHFRDTLWNHPANQELKRLRGNPNVLLPGDAVFVPNKRPKEESGSTDQHHKFKRRGEPEILRIRLLNDDDRAWVGQKYIFKIDDREYPGVTNEQGVAQAAIRGNARQAKLVLQLQDDDDDVASHENSDGEQDGYVEVEYELHLGWVDPVTELSGAQARLNNLDYNAGPETGAMTSRTEQALRQFQHAYGLTETGTADEATRQKLMEIHGS